MTCLPTGACDNSTTTAETLARLQSKVDIIVPLGSIVLSPDLKTQDHRYLLVTQPLVQNSTCSNCSSGFVCQISSEPPSVSGDVPLTMEIPVGPIDSGEYVAGSLFLQSSEGYCASELQESPLHQHVPVECTELDFHSTAVSTLDLDSTTDPDCSSVSLGITEISEIRDGSSGDRLGGRQLRRSPSDCPEEQTDSCWSSRQQPCNRSLGGSNAVITFRKDRVVSPVLTQMTIYSTVVSLSEQSLDVAVFYAYTEFFSSKWHPSFHS